MAITNQFSNKEKIDIKKVVMVLNTIELTQILFLKPSVYRNEGYLKTTFLLLLLNGTSLTSNNRVKGKLPSGNKTKNY